MERHPYPGNQAQPSKSSIKERSEQLKPILTGGLQPKEARLPGTGGRAKECEDEGMAFGQMSSGSPSKLKL